MTPWEFHPALIRLPIAFLLGGVAVDLAAWWKRREGWGRAATGLLTAGVASGVITAAASFLAFRTVPAPTEGAHRWMAWHLGLALTSLAAFSGVTLLRWRYPAMAAARVGGLAAAVLLSVAAYLGGRIVYHGGTGVNPSLLAPEVRGGHAHAGGGDGSHPDVEEGAKPPAATRGDHRHH